MRGIIVDNFAGGGGASEGISWALRRSIDIAINHDQDAIAMHSANHPDTLHYCESVFDVDPVQATAGKPVDLAWFSPDCKHFSKAKGSKPVSKQIRGLAWIVIRWALLTRPKVIMLENVEEFKTWGPVVAKEVTKFDVDGTPYTETEQSPCPDRKTETFKAFVDILSSGIEADHPALAECVEVLGLTEVTLLIKGLNYKVEWREMRACDFGAPTIRKRLFMIARCDGQPIQWPEPTHGKPNSLDVLSGKFLPWRTAAECIDWSIPCKSIFGRKKPLAEKTMHRIARGIHKFVIDAEQPFIAPVEAMITPFITEHANASGQRNMAVNEPLRTICAQVKGGHFAVVTPTIIRQFGNSIGHSITEPMGTVTAGGGGKSILTVANLAKHFGGFYTGPGADINHPLPTVTTVDHNALITSSMLKLRGTNIGFPTSEPAHTITAGGLHLGELRAFLIKYYGNEKDGVACTEPLHTITTGDRFGLIMIKGEPWQIIDIGMRMLEPHELFACQGFNPDYIIKDYNGRTTKKQQVARVGNSVPPQFAEALVRANLPELCSQPAKAA
ncbi:C-5 cytosine-specific DNA methylase [Shewanella psychrophila]|uniref:DNA (cytosine-5-)-methyltransferase n=1 Tax=Shewanella psychrophila TaxID=225848 RepID=A0A1S6HXS6_9GAMM|nr:DNA cytosine methyltransferase [Shewanella psychrophila]AQS40234.1 C-5 cytosine-specific DNA methylase [Shewanella psychrophila]